MKYLKLIVGSLWFGILGAQIPLFALSIQNFTLQNSGYARALWQSNLEIKLNLNLLATQQNKLFFHLTQKDPQDFIIKNLISTKDDISLPLLSGQNSFVVLDGKKLRPVLSEVIRGPLTLLVTNEHSQLVDKTSFQLAPLLDSYFYYEKDLGLIWNNNTPHFVLWAPTAIQVRLKVFESDNSSALLSTQNMNYNNGVWTLEGDPSWKNKFFRYEVVVFHPLSQKVETFEDTALVAEGTLAGFIKVKIINKLPQG